MPEIPDQSFHKKQLFTTHNGKCLEKSDLNAAKCKMVRVNRDSVEESSSDVRPAWDVYDKHVCRIGR